VGGTGGLLDGAKWKKSPMPAITIAATIIHRISSDPDKETRSSSINLPLDVKEDSCVGTGKRLT
jgi:hypothetical protein